jgi:hypothetical protein
VIEHAASRPCAPVYVKAKRRQWDGVYHWSAELAEALRFRTEEGARDWVRRRIGSLKDVRFVELEPE